MKKSFYKISGVFLILFFSVSSFAYYNTGFLNRVKGLLWTWISGSSSSVPSGSFSSVGVSNATNTPSAREGHTSWFDSSGNLWIFGGYGYDGYGNQGLLNDLWKYNTSTEQWTLMSGEVASYGNAAYGTKGVASAGNTPGPRDNSTAWVDASGNLWLFGGSGMDSSGVRGLLNDLWKFNTGTGQWTWMSGSNLKDKAGTYGTKGTGSTANSPGGRWQNQHSGKVDASGNLWLFGGNGYGSATGATGPQNDLWRYETANGKWTWMSGPNTINGSATYGTKGTGSTANTPGPRLEHYSWNDGTYVWLFGGQGKDSVGTNDYLNDLWQYEISTGKWKWVTGSNLVNAVGVYGAQGTSSASNTPGARYAGAGTLEAGGKLLLVGGEGIDQAGSVGFLGDVWSFDPPTGQWTWVSGGNSVTQYGTYGTRTVPSGSNKIGTRRGVALGYDGTNLWLFGGYGANSTHMFSFLNDVWKFNIGSNQWAWMAGVTTSKHISVYGTAGVASNNNMPGARAQSLTATDNSGNLWLLGGIGTDINDNVLLMNDFWKYSTATKQWTWISGSINGGVAGVYGTKGTGATTNHPGARFGGAMWADASGFLWLMGGVAVDSVGASAEMNDLWKYEVATKKWTWVTGSKTITTTSTYGTKGVANSNNTPGSRVGSVKWSDVSGNLWLMGGTAYDSTGNYGEMNDLWSFSTGTGMWTWVAGASTRNVSGTYGTKGVGNTDNTPGSRSYSAAWSDSAGQLWIFGGYGFDRAGSYAKLNDLWKFNPANNQWTWVTGADVIDQASVYGAKGVANTANTPSARQGSATWKDVQGNFYLMGGIGLYGGSSGAGHDVWKYTPHINQWAWIAGTQNAEPTGVYGTLGIGTPNNIPSGRYNGAVWSTPGNLWFLGGQGPYGVHNDLWNIQVK